MWVPDGQRVPRGQSSRKALGTGSRVRFPGGQEFTRVVTTCSWRNTGCSVWLHQKGTLGAAAGFPDFTHAPFVFPDLAWDPLAVMNHSHEYEYGWSPSVLLRIPEPGGGLGDPWLSPPSSGPGSTLTSSPVMLPPRLSPDSPTLAVPSVWSTPYIQPHGLFPHPVQGSSPVSPIRKAMLGHPV